MATAVPDWVVASEQTAAATAAWAEGRGLRYERLGLLPPASPNLRADPEIGVDGWSRSAPLKTGAIDSVYRSWDKPMERPVRFSENLCSGRLASGLEGTLAHHSSAALKGTTGQRAFTTLATSTAIVVLLPEAGRVTRQLEARPKPGRKVIVLGEPKREYGPLVRPVDLTPALGSRYQWSLWADDDPSFVAPVFQDDVMAALDAAPERTSVTVQGGALVVDANGYLGDAESLDALVRLAGALANGVRATATRLPRLEAGTALSPPADTPFRRWAREGAARIQWTSPPEDVPSAVSAYGAMVPRERGCSMAAATVALAVGMAVAVAAR